MIFVQFCRLRETYWKTKAQCSTYNPARRTLKPIC